MKPPLPIAEDMSKLKTLLKDSLSPHLPPDQAKGMRILNLACGRCDSCRIRTAGFHAAGVPDPTRYPS